MSLRLSMWSSFFHELTPEEATLELARAGWRYSELSDEHGRALLERGDPQQTGAEFARFANEHEVTYAQGHLWLTANIAPGDESQRQQTLAELRPWIDLYLGMGITAGVLHPGGHQGSPLAVREQRLASFAAIQQWIQGSDLCICIENCSSGHEVLDLLPELDASHFGLCLDTGHLNLTEESQDDVIRRGGGRLRALHLQDNNGEQDQHMVPYARGGTVLWPEVATALAAVSYGGLYNWEVPGENQCPLEARRIKLAHLRRMSEWLFDSADSGDA